MIICYYSKYFDEHGEPTSKIGHCLEVDHDKKEFIFHENAANPEFIGPEDCFQIMQRTNSSLTNLRRFLLNNGYVETKHIEGKHPWFREDK